MKIAIISDSHDHWLHLTEAVEKANAAGCQLLLHAGDLVSPPMIEILAGFKGKVKLVWGNNEMERLGILNQVAKYENISPITDYLELKKDGLRIFVQHYPKYAELAAKCGDYDLAIYGHTHVFEQSRIGDCLLINPGEIQGFKTGKPGFVIFDSKSQELERVMLTP